jgi:NAD(P)-dependent dehydrogenase (short-subunit alcohol dehydrogenase family)
LGRRVVTLAGDLAEPNTPKRLLAHAEEVLGPLHGFVNNAAACDLPDMILQADWGRTDGTTT